MRWPWKGNYKRTLIRAMNRGQLNQYLSSGTAYFSFFRIRQCPSISIPSVNWMFCSTLFMSTRTRLLSPVQNVTSETNCQNRRTNRGAYGLSCWALLPQNLEEEADNQGDSGVAMAAPSIRSYNWLLESQGVVKTHDILNTMLFLETQGLQNQHLCEE